MTCHLSICPVSVLSHICGAELIRPRYYCECQGGPRRERYQSSQIARKEAYQEAKLPHSPRRILRQ